MTTPPTPPPVDGTDWRYLSLVRELAAATGSPWPGPAGAAACINALIGDRDLFLKLLAVTVEFHKFPPPGLDELKQSFWRLAARQRLASDGSAVNPSSD